MIFSGRANGKLLLTAEYFVTDGATALALPTRKGQKLIATKGSEKNILEWQSFDFDGSCWLNAKFKISDLSLLSSSDETESKSTEKLREILVVLNTLNPNFFAQFESGLNVSTELEFPRKWGLGSSSTLISILADWAKVNPYELLEKTFGGSGYDLAAAKAEGPVLFRLFNGRPQSEISTFNPIFKNQLYFVYLNKKQDSREALVYYKVTPLDERTLPLQRITQITFNIAQYCKNLEEFELLILEHEELVQSIIKQPRAKESYFEDYWGEVKSLGGWGGDFVLVTSNEPADITKKYFTEKGFDIFIPYEEMIL
jgi:mevalonate kinase